MEAAFRMRVWKERRRAALMMPLYALMFLASVRTDTPIYHALQSAKTVTAWGGGSGALLLGTSLQVIQLTRALRDPAKLQRLEKERGRLAAMDDGTPAMEITLTLGIAGIFLSLLVSRAAMCLAFVVGIVAVSVVWNVTRKKP